MNEHAPSDGDAEFVERIRCGIAKADRFRWMIVMIYVVAIVMLVGLAVAIDSLVRNRVFQGMGPGFLVGISIGFSFGLLLVNVVHGLLGTIATGGRIERLLVKYFDISRQVETASDQ
jgi:NADH:ubiquinone oxidoreductase subunit 6 (subunit J)